jgi:BlaI family penicillinase repressor
MMHDNKVTISDAEMEVMRVVWDAAAPLTSNDIIGCLKKTSWNQSTILTLIKRLHDKNVLALDDPQRQRNKSYIAAISESDYKKLQTYRFIDKVFEGSAKGMFAALFDSADLYGNDLEQIKEWLREKEEK